MRKRERLALWILVGLLVVANLVLLPLLWGELTALRRELEAVIGVRPVAPASPQAMSPDGDETPLPTPAPNVGQVEGWGTSLQVRATGGRALTETTVISLTVRGSGAADPLLDLPLLVCDAQRYPVMGPSLEQARQDLLALITRGEAATALRFGGRADLTQACRVLLNPEASTTSVVAPRIEVPVPQQVPSPTATREAEESP